MHVTRQLRVVGKNGVAAHLAVMRQVDIGHDPVVVPDPRDARIPRRPDVEGAELAHRVAVADAQLAGLPGIFLVLGNRAQGVELEDAVVLADRGVAFEHAMRADGGAGIHLHVRADDGVGPDDNGAVELRLRVDDGRGMDLLHCGGRRRGQAIVRMVQMSSASTASSSPTMACALNLKMPERMRSSSACRISWSPGSTGRLKRAPSMPAK